MAQSILLCRERYAGNRKTWWSFKPPQYLEWLELSPIEQVAAQAVYTQKAVVDGMALVAPERKLELSYSDFCENPALIYHQIREKYGDLGYMLPAQCLNTKPFERRDAVRLSQVDECALREALAKFTNLCT